MSEYLGFILRRSESAVMLVTIVARQLLGWDVQREGLVG